jgi:hypothetical protein
MKSSESANNVSLIGEELLETISRNRLIVRYMDYKILPSIDELLDMRLALKELGELELISEHLMQAEMISIDFLLSKHK